jgi:hypothetical protein
LAYEQKDNSGTLFKNDKRTEHNNQPHARGDAMIGGVVYQISAWTKEGPKGRFQSLKIEPKQTRQDAAPTQEGYAGPPDDIGDEIPF